MADSDHAARAADIDYAAIVNSWTPEERAEKEKKFLRKIDARLLPILVGQPSPHDREILTMLMRKIS